MLVIGSAPPATACASGALAFLQLRQGKIVIIQTKVYALILRPAGRIEVVIG